MDEVVIIKASQNETILISSEALNVSDNSVLIENISADPALILATTKGMQGATGPLKGIPTFIQDTAPTPQDYVGYTKYAWFDTSGGDLTLWIEDGV
jgi:hypothetical protein